MKTFFTTTFLLVLVFFFYQTSIGQATFQETLGAPGIDKFNTIISTANEELIIAGESSNHVQGKGNAVIAKLNKTGQLAWVKTFGSLSDKENINDIKATYDNCYVAVGERYLSKPQGKGEVGILVKIDTLGNLKWWKEFDHNRNEAEGFCLQETADKGLVTAGMMKELQDVSDPFFTLKTEVQHLYVLKTDGNGVSQWAGYISGNYSSKGLYIKQTKDKGYIITGHVYKANEGEHTQICLLKLDEKGNMQWLKVYDNDGKKEETGMSVMQADDNGYMICGTTFDAGAGEGDVFLLKTNSNGDLSWKKTYGGNKTELSKSFYKLTDGGYAVAGTTSSFGNGSSDAFLMKLKDDGQVDWFKTYGSNFYEMTLGFTTLKDGYALTGYNINSGVVDGVCIRTDKNGDNGCNGSYTIISGEFPLDAVKYTGIKWDMTRNSTMVSHEDSNAAGSEAPQFTLKQFCEKNKATKTGNQ
jgi:hypothetical protein